jgi:plasmid stability protein
MPELRIRNVDYWIVETFRMRAKQHGRSMEAEIRELLASEAARPRLAFVEELRQSREELRQKYGLFPDSTLDIREDRDSRG